MTIVTGVFIDDAATSDWGREVVVWDPLPVEKRDDRTRVTRELREQLQAIGRPDLVAALDNGEVIWEATTLNGVDRSLVDARDSYQRIGDPVAVFLHDSLGAATAPEDR